MTLMAMGAALVFLVLSNLLQQYMVSFMAVRVDSAALDFITRRLLALPMSYFNCRRTGDIQRRLDGASQVRQFLVQNGLGGLLALVQLAGCLTLMGVFNFTLLGVFLLTLPLYGGLMLFSRKVLRPLFADIEESHGKYNSHQIDAIRGIEAVKAAAAELAFRDNLLNAFLSVSNKMLRSNFVMMSYENMVHAVSLLSTALFLWAGARMVMAGQFSIGAFVGFSSLMAMASASILRLLGIWDSLQFVSVLLNRLNDVLEQEPEQGRDRSSLKQVKSLEGRIELRNVGFRYGGPDSPPILEDITLDIPPGKTIALVGRSGCGKTTLTKLLAGLLEPTEGAIHYDHIDIKTLNYRDLRRHIGLVLQDNHIFNDSIANNIAFGDAEPDFERVLWAAQTANAHDFISRLPLGYETRVGESGLAVSGGQKQRIAIARALYQDPPVLIFDEATSALDTESERAIQSNMAQLKSGRTCVVVAHRLSTIRDADLIVVLERGRVAETGTHDELMTRRGLYFYLSSQQMTL
jgi:ATP-binding cassette subfamily B protein